MPENSQCPHGHRLRTETGRPIVIVSSYCPSTRVPLSTGGLLAFLGSRLGPDGFKYLEERCITALTATERLANHPNLQLRARQRPRREQSMAQSGP